MLSQPPRRPRRNRPRPAFVPQALAPMPPRPFAGGARITPRPGRASGVVGTLLLHLCLVMGAVGLGTWQALPEFQRSTPDVIEVSLVDLPELPEQTEATPVEVQGQSSKQAGDTSTPAHRPPVAPPAVQTQKAPARNAPPPRAKATPPRQAPLQAARPKLIAPTQADLMRRLEQREAASPEKQQALALAASQAAANEGAAASTHQASPAPYSGGVQPSGQGKTSSGGLDGDLAGRGLLRRIDPSYPSSMEAVQDEGSVRCRLHVSPDGRVQQVVVVAPSGRGAFDVAAVQALRRWRFTPLPDPNGPLQQGEITVTFRLQR